MKKVKRMNDQIDTASRLVEAAITLFSQNGYDGTSVRAITAHAGANLGAITYHFGSKEALYDAALESVSQPIRLLAGEAAKSDGPPLFRIAQLVRVFFQHLSDNPEFPNMISHHLASSHRLPNPARETIQRNVKIVASLIAEGQQDGTIRDGKPRDMALSIAAQPMWLTLARRALLEASVLDQDDPATRERIVESVVQFVEAGLRIHQEDQQ